MPEGKVYRWRPAAAVLLAVLVLHGYPVCRPLLLYDDFQIMARAATWPVAWANLWVPQNEHAMPLGQLSTCALLQLAGGQSAWPRAAALQGLLALLAGLPLLYLFARREFGHSLYGLMAAALFGVSAMYQQAVNWFAASFSVLALDTLLLALLAAQAWRRTGRAPCLFLCVAACGLAPAWSAGGLVAGPLCALYLALPGPAEVDSSARPVLGARTLLAAVPLAGTAAFLAVSLPRTGARILYLEHYEGKTAVQAFDAAGGLVYTLRSVADNLVLGTFGISLGFFPEGNNLPLSVALPLAALFGAALVWWSRPLAQPRPAALGLGLIALSYFLTYSARAGWPYEDTMNRPLWSRYHLLPQLGLALLVSAGLPRGEGRWFRLEPAGALSRKQAHALLVLIGLLLVSQLPRAILGMVPADADQEAALHQVEEVDKLCRTHRISAATAREALGPLLIPHCHRWNDGWLLLRGSAEPREVSVEEARRLLGNAQ